MSRFGACCCCICAAVVVAGGARLACEDFIRKEGSGDGNRRNADLILAESIMLISAAATFLLACCGCCFSCTAVCAPAGGDGEDPVLGLLVAIPSAI